MWYPEKGITKDDKEQETRRCYDQTTANGSRAKRM